MIEIQGFTPLQRELADRIWGMDSKEEIMLWVQTMPKSVAIQAWVVMQMIIATELDHYEPEDNTQVLALLDRIRHRD